jgi:ribose/xylose/arabinose/galactoside ABC-type transport system permease subunit
MASNDGSVPRSRVTFDVALREYGIYAVLVGLVAIFSLVAPGFASLNNLILILLQVSVMGILSIAMLFVILARGIDLSVGSILAITGMFSGLAARQDPTVVTVLMAFGLPIVLGVICGLFNGYLVSWGGLPPLIVTLGTMYAYRGFIVWYHVDPVYRLQEWYRALGQERIGPVPIPVIILLLVVVAASIVLNRTPFGRQIYAVGGNEEAARASGINVNLVKLGVYTISGALCGLAGLVFTSRLGAAQSISGMGFELIAIASVVVGGASLFGGRGTVGKALVGALIMQIVQSALVMLDVPSPIQQATLGLIIIGAVFVDLRVQNQRAGRRVVSLRGLLSGSDSK